MAFGDWTARSGTWAVRGETYVQTNPSADCRALAAPADWTDYVYEVSARKTGGHEGFLVLFRVRDHDHFYWWNIGGWGNTGHALETRGTGGKFPHVGGRIETGRWYRIRIVVKGPSLQCYLDGKLIHDVKHSAYARGGIGLGTWATQAEYKDVSVTSLDGRKLYGMNPREMLARALRGLGRAGGALQEEFGALGAGGAKEGDPRWAALYKKAVDLHRQFASAREKLPRLDVPAVRGALEPMLAARSPELRARAKDMLARLAGHEARLAATTAALAAGDPTALAETEALLALAHKARDLRSAMFAERCPPVAFIRRAAHGRNGTNGTMHGRATGVGSAICVYDPARPERGATTIFEDKTGFIFDMAPSYDGTKLLFAYKKDVPRRQDSFHIYEINTDGTNLKQLTTGRYHDVSGVYLPDGRIVFNSTRVESFSLCQDFIAAALYVMNADGSGLRRIEYNTLCDTTPWVMDDGSILFTRWEYQDKNIFCTQGLWTINPDGTRLQLFYGNTLLVPNAIYGAKQIPGTDKVLCVMAAHHHPPLGGIAIIDRRGGLESAESMTTLTPDVPYRPTTGRNWKDTNWGPGDQLYPWSYTDPWPVTEDLFLVSYGGDGVNKYRLFLLDDRGKKALLYEDPKLSCYNPVPLRPRPRPQTLPGQVPQPKGFGTFYVADVYQGLLGKGVKRGDVKALRILSQSPKKYNTEGPRYHDHYPIIGYGSYYVKICYGTVPVDAEGAAYFQAPAGVELYFEAVDATGKEIRRMGTVTQITDGEYQGCIGCHESRSMTPPRSAAALRRLSREPDTITPPPWGAGPISFVRQVQPVLDKHCAKCHATAAPKGGVDLSGGRNRFFNMAYKTLIDRRLVDYYYINQGPTGNFPPLASGSRVSKLVHMIESGHKDRVKMPPADRRRIYNWIDANCNYYDTWDMSRPWSQGGRDAWTVPVAQRGRPPAAPWIGEFRTLFATHCASCHGLGDTWINLTRPEHSRALAAHLAAPAGGMGLDKPKGKNKPPVFTSTADPVYQALLRTIQAGKAALDRHPRMDMPGAKPIPQQRDFGRTY